MSNLPIENLISNLGFSSSKNLVYKNGFINQNISKHDIKILNEINPFAVYLVDNKPFVLFIESSISDSNLKNISKLVWNSQIPVAFVCDSNSVKIFNGKSMDFETKILNEIGADKINNFTHESEFSFYKISDPLFWDKYEKAYSQLHLNEYLLKNIMSLTDVLKNTYKIKFATKLVLRLIFIRYLIDRGVDLDYNNFSCNVDKSQQALLTVCKDKEQLYKLFQHLKDKFNGNLFELGDEITDLSLISDVFELLSEFLSGDIDLGSGQRSLFAMYDFKIIPVELISNIYEILLGKETRDKDNAFYTPNYLAEYILDKTTLAFLKSSKKYKILDPSCGSGIFLVNSFKRMIDINIGANLFCDDDELLQNILKNNIYGIDINEDAIDVTIFSLYLTVLDYKNPKSLSCFKLPNLKNKNLVVTDFFDDRKLESFKNIEFDFIIGNPPWGSVSDGMHLQYCKEHGHDKRQQNKEICRSFVFRAKDFSSKNTVCSFILHSKILYTQKEPSRRFRQYLLKETKILDIVEMSSVRKLVFKNANAPAAIITFNYDNENDNLKNRIAYTSLKPNMFFKLFSIIVVEKYDVKYVPQSLLYKNDWAWKTIVYGFSRDIENISNLKNRFESLGKMLCEQSPKIIMGEGVQYLDGDMKDATHLYGKYMLDSKNGVDHFCVNRQNMVKFNKTKIHRPRDKKLFEPPYSINSRGVNCDNYRMRAVCTEEKFICKHAMYIIKGSDTQKNILNTVTALLNSSFYSYLNLMLGSSIGIEREQRSMKEVLTFPYIYSKEIDNQSDYITNCINAENKDVVNLILDRDIETELKKLDMLILKEFDLQDNAFIDYTLNIQIPELTNSKEDNIYRIVTSHELKAYAQCFAEQFTFIYNKVGKGVCIKLYPEVLKRYVVFEVEITDTINNVETIVNSAPKENMELFTRIIRHDYNEMFHQIRDVIHFSENSFYIIKPNNYKYWHPAIAQMDLDDVLDHILSDDGGEG